MRARQCIDRRAPVGRGAKDWSPCVQAEIQDDPAAVYSREFGGV